MTRNSFFHRYRSAAANRIRVIIKQDGGLGNQLFQYAAGLYFARKHQGSLSVAVDRSVNLFSHGDARPFLLPNFSITASYSEISEMERLILSISPRINLAAKPIRRLRRIQVIRENSYQNAFNPLLEISSGTRIAYLVGKWQYHPPAQKVEDELRAELRFRKIAQGLNHEYAQRIHASDNAVSLHIRRGDYASEYPDAILPAEYYSKARDLMKARLGAPRFFIFSDDPYFAHQFAFGKDDCVVVDHNRDPDSAVEDLRLISLCRHHIIANSTFSWWGAWLNPRRDKNVFAPRRWTKFETEKSELALPGWTFI